jgi:hypothetical protein
MRRNAEAAQHIANIRHRPVPHRAIQSTTTGNAGSIISVEPVVAVGLEHGAAEGADDGAPGAAVHGEEVAEPGGRLHVCDAAATGADPRRRLAAPHRPPLVHQEAEEHHLLSLASSAF